jgi:transposase
MMSAYSKAIPCIPKETVRAAHASFGRSNFYILVGDHLQRILEELDGQRFWEGADLSKVEDVTLPLITFFQFIEGLTDAQAMEAVRTRTDWKFALHLSLFPGMLHKNALCRFRQRIFSDFASEREFQKLIDRLIVLAPALHHDFQNLKSLEVVSLVCSLNCLHQAQQAMNQALEVLAVRCPQWLRKIALPHWYGRYNPTVPRLDVAILLGQQRFLMEEIASDIHHLLEKVHQSGSGEIRELHEVKVLNRVRSQLFQVTGQSQNNRLEAMNIKDCDFCFHDGAEGRRPAQTNQ